jgi:hypothetical protein
MNLNVIHTRPRAIFGTSGSLLPSLDGLKTNPLPPSRNEANKVAEAALLSVFAFITTVKFKALLSVSFGKSKPKRA